MTHDQILELTDDGLIAHAERVAATARATTVELIQLLIEVERRRLHLALGHASLFVFCTSRLKLAEAAAYGRITAARAARRFPVVLDMLRDGSMTLSGLGRLASHLTEDNVAHLLDAARFKSTREVERICASIGTQPNARPACAECPARRAVESSRDAVEKSSGAYAVEGRLVRDPPAANPQQPQVSEPAPPAAPPAPANYLLKVTIGLQTHQKLEQLRALLRHQIPDGDIAEILDRALTVLLDRTVRARCSVRRTSSGPSRHTSNVQVRSASPAPGRGRRGTSGKSRSRHIPAEVRRAVWTRDQGRCAFVGADGRCHETGFIEVHHVQPFAAGGPSTVDNLELRCRAHNAYEAALIFGEPQGVLHAGCSS